MVLIYGKEVDVNSQNLTSSNNQITKIEGLETLVELYCLELSNNQITKIEGLETLVELWFLYLDDNQISKTIKTKEYNIRNDKYFISIQNKIIYYKFIYKYNNGIKFCL